MKEIIAVVRMNKTNATKKALIESGAAGFTALKVLGRGKIVEDKSVIAARKANMMEMAIGEDAKEAEILIDSFLDGQRLFPRRMFHIIAKDKQVESIVQAKNEVSQVYSPLANKQTKNNSPLPPLLPW